MTVGVAARTSLVEGEYTLAAVDFEALAAILRHEAGIALGPGKAVLLYSRLTKRLRALSLSDFAQYRALLESSHGREERGRMVAALTTNFTRFFREPHHFDHLRVGALPHLLQAAQRGRRVRIWSAGCSTGQEPYSIALTVLQLAPNAPRLDVRVIATDIDPDALAQAAIGSYGMECLEHVPANLRSRWFDPAANGAFVLNDAVRRLVLFRPLNLVGSWPVRGPFDIIMCRNVAIYFDAATQEAMWQRFPPYLASQGLLYIGRSEKLSGPAAARFDMVGTTIYQRRGVP